MKKILELLVCILHPIAVILIWVNLVTRSDIGALAKVAWAVFSLIPLVPFLYVLTGGDLW
jgi:succinate dehydrogenase hydrophobic anchor subunit